MGLAGASGIILFLLSAFISIFLSASNFYIIMFALTILSLIFIKVYLNFFASKTVKIAVPVVRFVKSEKPKPVVSQAKSADNIGKTASKVGSDVGKAFSSISSWVSEKMKPKPVQSVKEETKPTQKTEQAIQEIELVQQPEIKQPLKKPEVSKSIPGIKPKTAPRHGRDRYRRKEELVNQAKAELYSQSSEPLPIVDESEVNLEMGEGLELSDLETTSDLGELGGEEGLGDLENSELSLNDLAGLSEIQEIPKEKGMKGCPKCHNKNTTIIYCPYCGKGFCSNCADNVKTENNLIFYVCPHCKKEVIVKK